MDAESDADSFTTIRIADGTISGNTDEQPIATVYEEADARLIAAAPALLDALKELTEIALIDTDDIEDEPASTRLAYYDRCTAAYNAAVAAIAAAEGR